MTADFIESFFARLTDKELEALNHRLEAGDAIADALEITHDRDEVEWVAEALYYGDFKTAAEFPEVTRDVIDDCVTGSTMCGSLEIDCDITPQKAAAVRRTMRSLAAKVERFTGRPCVAPEC